MKDNPYTEFGANQDVTFWFPQTEEGLKGYKLVEVEFTSQPYYNPITKGIKEGTPVEVDGSWHQVWEVYNLTEIEIEQNKMIAKEENKALASRLLVETDWTELADVTDTTNVVYLMNKNEYRDYRAKLRMIVINPPVIVNGWPVKPVAVWSDAAFAQIGVDRV